MSAPVERGAVVLGAVGLVASWQRPARRAPINWQPMLIIMASDSTDDGVHTPAASVTLSGTDKLIALRSAIDEALKEPTA